MNENELVCESGFMNLEEDELFYINGGSGGVGCGSLDGTAGSGHDLSGGYAGYAGSVGCTGGTGGGGSSSK